MVTRSTCVDLCNREVFFFHIDMKRTDKKKKLLKSKKPSASGPSTLVCDLNATASAQVTADVGVSVQLQVHPSHL